VGEMTLKFNSLTIPLTNVRSINTVSDLNVGYTHDVKSLLYTLISFDGIGFESLWSRNFHYIKRVYKELNNNPDVKDSNEIDGKFESHSPLVRKGIFALLHRPCKPSPGSE